MANIRAYAQMVETARRQQLPEHYETDLYCIDRACLEEPNAPRQFGWILYECGTRLITDKETARGTKAYYACSANVASTEKAAFYWYDGNELIRVKPDELWEFCRSSNLPQKWGPPTASFHNRNGQLHIQEAARLGKVKTQLSFATTLPSGKLEYEHFNFPHMRGIDYDL